MEAIIKTTRAKLETQDSLNWSHWPECVQIEYQKGVTALDSNTMNIFRSVNL